MSKLLLALLVCIAATGCTAPDRSRTVLEGAGYTHIEFTGYSWFACSEDDTYRTAFKAIGPTGKAVSGTVCAGLFKGATIRMD